MTSVFSAVIAAAGAAIVLGPATLNARPGHEHLARASLATPSFAEPAISPDRGEIAFLSGGDVWTVALAGGEARLLVSHPANETRPLYSPDGKRLAFVSDRSGNGDVYVLTFATGDVRRLTFDDQLDQLDGWSRDGRWLYFTSSARDISSMNDVYRVSADGGTPMPVSADRYASEYWAAPSPTDAGTTAFTARGVPASQWWRKGHSHLDESEIWLVRDAGAAESSPRYERLSGGAWKDEWPMWSPDGRVLYFVSDRDGAQNLWAKPLQGDARAITRFRDGRVLWPTIAYDGRTIVFERDFRIWSMDVAGGEPRQVPITLRGASASAPVEHLRLTSQFQSLALAPDGKKIAFVAHGEVFAASAREASDATRLTVTPAAETQLDWSPDSRKIAYASQRDGMWHLFLYDLAARTETQLTRGAGSDVIPSWAPDGGHIAFVRDGREVRLLDVATGQERLLTSAYVGQMPFISSRRLQWSSDGQWLAFRTTGAKQFSNVSIVAVAGGEARPVSFLPNVFGGSIAWSPDGTYLLFDTSQRTEEGEVARVDLVPRTPKFREDQFRDLFRDDVPHLPPAPTRQPARDSARADSVRADTAHADAARREGTRTGARNPRRIPAPVFEGIRRRVSMLPVGLDISSIAISPDGKSALLTANAAGQQNLYVYPLDELATTPAVARQLTSTPGQKASAQWTPDSREIFYLEGGRVTVMPVDSRQARTIAVSAELDVDFEREKMAVFNQAWTYLNDNFFDPKFNGVNWQSVRDDYAPRIAGARTGDEMRRLLSLMVGELNSSHSGVGAPAGSGSARNVTGRLGVRFDRGEYERAGRLKVTEVIPLGPAALAGMRGRPGIVPGDYLLAVDGVTIDAHTNLDSLLAHKVDRRVSLTVARSADAARTSSRELVVQPVNGATEKALLYRAWVESRREYVSRASGGRLGYVHMPDMSEQSLGQLYLDLDAENHAKEGVVVDVRNNQGGFVNAYALDVLARRGYMSMTYRGLPAAPARTVLGQRALEAPTVLVTNQHSLSDAEDFTEGYRALKLGPVVGEPTAGWIVYTSNGSLLDGSSVRLPFIRITDHNGQDMEMHPRPVDVSVERPIGESYTSKDVQLDAAVRELLKVLGRTASAER